MDKRVIFSVAGSGKTSYIIGQLNLIDPSLIVTYTNNNYGNIIERIIERWGYLPDNIKVLTYFSFLHSFCFKPLLGHQVKSRGILFEPNQNLYATGDARFISGGGRLFSNRISKFFSEKGIIDEINKRIEKYCKNLYIDEVQDFGGHDFNFLKEISKAKVNVIMVGDFYQHTFDTSRDGSVNKNLHADFHKYEKEFSKMKLQIDKVTLSKSYRCGPEICSFITKSIGIEIESHRFDKTDIKNIETKEEAMLILKDPEVIKLFYQQHYVYNTYSKNWGDSKGEDKYADVCVVMNKNTYQFYKKDKLAALPPTTRNKLYVACSRPKGDLYILSEHLVKNT
jgi:DNA helicase II / ATP-dependent DNA helicase PcrA